MKEIAMEKYHSIVDMPYPKSKLHPRLSMQQRAAQFAPFAALTGHNVATSEAQRYLEEPLELADDAQEELKRKLDYLASIASTHPRIIICYFEEDGRKAGGFYRECQARLAKLDAYRRVLILEQGITIAFDNLRALEVMD